jgi:hypothetical protein
MQIPVLIESVAGNGYRARVGEPLAMSAEGATADEALRKLHELINKQLAQGAQLVPLEVTTEEKPWMRFAGMFKDDPYFEDWQKAIAEYRRQVDEDLDTP